MNFCKSSPDYEESIALLEKDSHRYSFDYEIKEVRFKEGGRIIVDDSCATLTIKVRDREFVYHFGEYSQWLHVFEYSNIVDYLAVEYHIEPVEARYNPQMSRSICEIIDDDSIYYSKLPDGEGHLTLEDGSKLELRPVPEHDPRLECYDGDFYYVKVFPSGEERRVYRLEALDIMLGLHK